MPVIQGHLASCWFTGEVRAIKPRLRDPHHAIAEALHEQSAPLADSKGCDPCLVGRLGGQCPFDFHGAFENQTLRGPSCCGQETLLTCRWQARIAEEGQER